jgi:two-component system, NtrC family, sensor histidine kinase HydH
VASLSRSSHRSPIPVERLTGVLEHLQHDLAAMGLEADLLLLDETGTVIAGGWLDEASDLLGQNLRAAGWQAAREVALRSRPSYLREPNVAAIVGYAPIPAAGLGWSMLAEQSFREAFAPVRALRRTMLLALAAILLATLGVAGLIADRLTKPIRELTQATLELARTGEASAPVAVRSRDEIGGLAQAFNRMASDLNSAREDLLTAAKLAFAGELAAGMTHEIRTPLGIVRSSAQILNRSLPASDQRSRELVDMIVEEVDRLDRVVSGLLELARPRAPLVESAALGPILSRAIDFVSYQAGERGIALRSDLSAPLRNARCDPDQIYQVALNLIMNALQILPRGGTVEVRTFAAGSRVGFEVSDDGPGVAAEDRERIFTPFFTRRPGGTGLGLALVQRIVHSHKGSIVFESEPGRGARFRVELPISEGTA